MDDPFTADLAWLMHRAGKVLSDDFDAMADGSACRTVETASFSP